LIIDVSGKSIKAFQELILRASEKNLVKMRTARMVKTYQFRPTDAEPFYLEIIRGQLSVRRGEAASPVATITGSDEDLEGLFTGRLEPLSLYLAGRIKVSGSLFDAQELATLLRDASR